MRVSAATAAVSARSTRGPRLSRRTLGTARIAARSRSSKPPSGPMIRPTPWRRRRVRKRVERTRLRRLFVAKDEQPFGRPFGEDPVERLGAQDFGRPDHAALLAGLDRVGHEALDIEPRDLGAPRQDRPQAARAHLDRLLRHIVEAGVLQRREQIVDVGGRFLRAGPRADEEGGPFSRDGGERGGIFAVAPVEHEDARRRAEPEHVDEIVGLLGGQRQRCALGQRRGRRKGGAS